MSRSIGDFVANSVGVISEPEVYSRLLKKEDKFIILASDGLWEFITSKEAVEIVGDLIDTGYSQNCCDVLVREATTRWSKNDETIDDITVIVAFLSNSQC